MIRFYFTIANPFSKSWASIKNYYVRDYRITENKHLEIQIGKCDNLTHIFSLEFDTRWQGADHAGIKFYLTVLHFICNIQLYDRRHWDDERNDWAQDD